MLTIKKIRVASETFNASGASSYAKGYSISAHEHVDGALSNRSIFVSYFSNDYCTSYTAPSEWQGIVGQIRGVDIEEIPELTDYPSY